MSVTGLAEQTENGITSKVTTAVHAITHTTTTIPAGFMVIFEGKVYCWGIDLQTLLMLLVGVFSLIFIIVRGYMDITVGIAKIKIVTAEKEDSIDLLTRTQAARKRRKETARAVVKRIFSRALPRQKKRKK